MTRPLYRGFAQRSMARTMRQIDEEQHAARQRLTIDEHRVLVEAARAELAELAPRVLAIADRLSEHHSSTHDALLEIVARDLASYAKHIGIAPEIGQAPRRREW